MILEYPNFVDLETVEEIRQTIKPLVGEKVKAQSNRDGFTVDISRTPELAELDKKVQKIFMRAQSDVIQLRYRPNQPSADSGYEYHIYRPGDICHVHCDGEVTPTDKYNDKAPYFIRYASVVLHLNTVNEGGELIFPAQNKKVKTEAGKLVVFPPYGMYQHYTSPSEETREVIVTWFIYANFRANKIG